MSRARRQAPPSRTTPSSPLPTAEPLSASLPLPLAGRRRPQPGTGRHASPHSSRRPPPRRAQLERPSARSGGPLTNPLPRDRESSSQPPAGHVLTEDGIRPWKRERLDCRISITSYEFQFAPTESEAAESWSPIEDESPSTKRKSTFKHKLHPVNGLYNLRVIVTTAEGGTYESELRDRLIANGSPVVDAQLRPEREPQEQDRAEGQVPAPPTRSPRSASSGPLRQSPRGRQVAQRSANPCPSPQEQQDHREHELRHHDRAGRRLRLPGRAHQ